MGRHKLSFMNETAQLKQIAFELAVKSLGTSNTPNTPANPDAIRDEAEKIYQWLVKS